MSRYHRRGFAPSPGLKRAIKKAVVRTHGLVCWLCKLSIATFEEVTLDHVKKVAKGGTWDEENLRPAHAKCNNERHRKVQRSERHAG